MPDGAWPVIAPSPIPYSPRNQTPEPMTRATMRTVRDQFVRATQGALRAGFDLLELHCAHGYLLSYGARARKPPTGREDGVRKELERTLEPDALALAPDRRA